MYVYIYMNIYKYIFMYISIHTPRATECIYTYMTPGECFHVATHISHRGGELWLWQCEDDDPLDRQGATEMARCIC